MSKKIKSPITHREITRLSKYICIANGAFIVLDLIIIAFGKSTTVGVWAFVLDHSWFLPSLLLYVCWRKHLLLCAYALGLFMAIQGAYEAIQRTQEPFISYNNFASIATALFFIVVWGGLFVWQPIRLVKRVT